MSNTRITERGQALARISPENEIVLPVSRDLARDFLGGNDRLAINAILAAYNSGQIGAVEAYYAMEARDLFGTIPDFMEIFAAGWAAMSRRHRWGD